MDVRKVEVFKITERKAGAVYKTRKIKTIWIPSGADEATVAAHHGGDIIAATTEWLFGIKKCEPLGQEQMPE